MSHPVNVDESKWNSKRWGSEFIGPRRLSLLGSTLIDPVSAFDEIIGEDITKLAVAANHTNAIKEGIYLATRKYQSVTEYADIDYRAKLSFDGATFPFGVGDCGIGVQLSSLSTSAYTQYISIMIIRTPAPAWFVRKLTNGSAPVTVAITGNPSYMRLNSHFKVNGHRSTNIRVYDSTGALLLEDAYVANLALSASTELNSGIIIYDASATARTWQDVVLIEDFRKRRWS